MEYINDLYTELLKGQQQLGSQSIDSVANDSEDTCHYYQVA